MAEAPGPRPAQEATAAKPQPAEADLRDPRERRLRNVRQITFGGRNAEAYWSFAGDRLILQRTAPPYQCDQIFVVPLRRENGLPGPAGDLQLVSTGKGRTTCAYFFPGDERILFSSTHLAGPECPPVPGREEGYVWPVYASYDVFTARPDGSDLVRLTDTGSYDAEATVCPATGEIVFTSGRDGDLDLYLMDGDGGNVRRLTRETGYDGGAFFSPDGSRIVWRAHHPRTEAELARYRDLLGRGLVGPPWIEVFVMDRDGTDRIQVTDFGRSSFCPFFHPDGRRIVFASNMDDPSGRNFELYLIRDDGTGLERITYNEGFDGFPMFSPDGRFLAFSSTRNARSPREINVFVAEWVEGPGDG